MVKNSITIVIPVYADWPSLRDCLDSLKAYYRESSHRIILVNDCGPEADLIEKNIKLNIKNTRNFFYYRNPTNLGFVKTCNRAVVELDRTKNDVLLLNSDTVATAGFLEEMTSVMLSNPKIGTVSPRTNNATICTFPLAAIGQRGLEEEVSYELFQKFHHKFPKYNIIPTGHGFCLLIKRHLIDKYGLFDLVFGKGYGEEVDFCLRVAKKGWTNTLSNHAYVFHREARSFSLESKLKMIAQNTKIIECRYPGYKEAVDKYIKSALLREKRLFGKNLNEILHSGSKKQSNADSVRSPVSFLKKKIGGFSRNIRSWPRS